MEKIAKKVARKLNDWNTQYSKTEVIVTKEIEGKQVKVNGKQAWINGELVATLEDVCAETVYFKKTSILMQNEIEYALVHIAKYF